MSGLKDKSVDSIRNILDSNKNKSFVDRILNKDKYPTMDLGNGNYATHKMAWAEVGGKYIVYPTILWDGKQLKAYSPQEAWNHVKSNGNFIEFDNSQDADWFSKNYKKVWE